MTHVCTNMIIAMMVAHLLTASAATAAPARIDATFSFLRAGASDFESSSFSGIGDLFLFTTLIEDRQTGERFGPELRASVFFDITDGDIHAVGSFPAACLTVNPCVPPEAFFQYQDSSIGPVDMFGRENFNDPGSPTFFGATFFDFSPGGVLIEGNVSGTALIPEPSVLVLLTSAIAALGAIGLKRRRSA
jgi:hypothetical protein